jgi:hypothetical protein
MAAIATVYVDAFFVIPSTCDRLVRLALLHRYQAFLPCMIARVRSSLA